MPLLVQSTKQKDPSFNLTTIKNHMQSAINSRATLKETQVAIVKMYQNGTTKKLSPQAQQAAQVLARYIYDHKATKKFEFKLGKDHQEKQLLLLSIAKQQPKTRNGAPLQRSMNELANDLQRQDVLTLVRHLPWVPSVLQKVEFGILFWIHQRKLSSQEALAGTSGVPPALQVVNFQRMKTAQELLQDKAWVKIIQVVQSLTTQQLGITVDVEQLPSQTTITPKDIALVIKRLIPGNDTTSKVARDLMNEAHIKVQPVDETGAINITISKYGHDKLITIFGFKPTNPVLARAQIKINHAQDGATPPTKLKQVAHGQTPGAEDVHPPTKGGVVFTFHSATPVNDLGQASLTYEVSVDPQVEGTTTRQVIFVVGDFEIRVQAHARWASLAQAAIQTLEVADFRTGIDKTQIASTGKPSRVQVISDIRRKIHNQDAKALILEDDLTITPDNIAKTVTITISNHGPTKTITIPGFNYSIKGHLGQLLEAIPPSGGALIIPEGITTSQFNEYVQAIGFYKIATFSASKFSLKYRARITSLTIPNSFTTIGSWFKNFAKITSLSMSSNVITIAKNAFFGAKLSSLTIPNSVTTIGDYAFYNSPLTSLKLGTKLKVIGDYAFTNAQLTSLTIPALVTSIGHRTFQDSPLTSLTLGTNLQTIGNEAFKLAKLTSLIIPTLATTIGNSAFHNAPLTSLTLGANLQTIGNEAFYNARLTSLTIPASVTSIGDKAFYNGRLTSLTLGANLQSIGLQAFYNAQLTSLTIPASVTSFGYQAFYNAPIVTITIFNDVKLDVISFKHPIRIIRIARPPK